MPDLTSSAELEYITWKAITTYIVNKLWQDATSWDTKLRHGGGRVEISGLMAVRSLSKAQLAPSRLQFTTVSKPSPPPFPHFPTRDTTNTLLNLFFYPTILLRPWWKNTENNIFKLKRRSISFQQAALRSQLSWGFSDGHAFPFQWR